MMFYMIFNSNVTFSDDYILLAEKVFETSGFPAHINHCAVNFTNDSESWKTKKKKYKIWWSISRAINTNSKSWQILAVSLFLDVWQNVDRILRLKSDNHRNSLENANYMICNGKYGAHLQKPNTSYVATHWCTNI